MYTRFTRRPIRQNVVDTHCGQPRDFLARHQQSAAEAVGRGEAVIRQIGPQLLQRIADTRNLRLAWDYLAVHGGQAPGPNGLRYDDLEGGEVWDLVRALGIAIRTGGYRPGPHKERQIAKTSGRGYRTLKLQNIEDRVVQRAIVQIIQPVLDPGFDEDSYGFRPGLGRHNALARAERLTTYAGFTTWIVDDVRDAFDKVPRNRLLDVLARKFPRDVVDLIRVVTDAESKRGLRQGSPLSPLLLNVYLDHFVDRPWRQRHPDQPLIRTADDILILCGDGETAQEAYVDLSGLLNAAGLPLKGICETAIRDLAAGDHAAWLGFDIGLRDGAVTCQLSERVWRSLAAALASAHEKPNSPLVAVDIISGWLDQAGPCYASADRDAVLDRLIAVAQELAFDELPARDELLARWQQAAARFERLLG